MPDPQVDAPPSFDALIHSPLFAGAPAPVLLSMFAGCETRDLAKGERLLASGETNDALYVILTGTLSVHVPGTGRPHVQLGRGEVVGELSLIDGFRVSADVIADEDTTVVTVEREQVWRLIEATSQVARNLLRILAGRVRHDDRMLGEADRLQRQFEEAATVDPLTGLRNRRWLDAAFTRQLDRTTRTGRPLSVLMIDADYFKRVNDNYGHVAGDEALVTIGRTLAACLRPQDLLARFGGEEFAVLLPGVPTDTALMVGERLRAAVARLTPLPVTEALPDGFPLTVSIGIATALPGQETTVTQLVARADAALYRAKHFGRNQVCGEDAPR